MFNSTIHICVRGNASAACYGDSGGPLLIRRRKNGGWRWEQIGVANIGAMPEHGVCVTPGGYFLGY
jgi:secreted trypsin-like serine protease